MIPLTAALVAGSLLVFFFRFDLEEPRRWILALATFGFFFAPVSERPLRAGLWGAAVALVAWGAQLAGSGKGGLALWLASSVAGALLVVRGGSRAAAFYLPEAGSHAGRAQRRRLRTELQISVGLFLIGYLLDRRIGTTAVVLSALFFLRYVLLQSKYLGLGAIPVHLGSGVVPSQRWALLAAFALVGGTGWLQAIVGERGRGSLLLTAALLLITAALVFALTLARTDWPRPFVRRTSFIAGIALAVTVTAVLVELESWDRSRYRVFVSAGIAFLVMLPFLRSQTRLFDRWPRFAALVPPAVFSVMMAPVTAVSGTGASFSTTVFLVTFAALVVAYYLVVALRQRPEDALYLVLSLVVLGWAFFTGGGDRSWQVFLLSVGLVLYSVDLVERLWRELRLRARIAAR